MRLSPRRRICVEYVGPQIMRVRKAETPAAEVDRRLTGHLQPRNTCKSFLGRRPGVTWFPERASFLARVLFYGPCARISGSGSPGSSDAAGAPGIRRENNAGPKTHVLGAPSVRALASTLLLPTALLSTLLLPTALLKGASVRSGSLMSLLLPGLS